MRHIILNHNLLGDSLFPHPAIRGYKQRLPPTDTIIMVVGPEQYNLIHDGNPYIDSVIHVSHEQFDQLSEKYCKGVRGKWCVVSSKNGQDRAIILDVNAAYLWCTTHPRLTMLKIGGVSRAKAIPPNLTEGFAQQFNLNIDSPHYDVVLTDEELVYGEEYVSKFKKPLLVCAAISSSCSSRSTKPGEENMPANKMLSAEVWNEVVTCLKDEYDFIFTAASNEKLLDIDAEWLVGEKIRNVAAICKASACVVSIDTGISHLAAAVDSDMVLIAAAVPSALTSPQTRGKMKMVDHSDLGSIMLRGISTVTSKEIVEAIYEVTR